MIHRRKGRWGLQGRLEGFVHVGVFTILISQSAVAGGAKIPNQSTRAMGMSDAFIAGADDASAVYYNPAGLTRIPAFQVIANTYVAHATVYADEPGTDETSDGRIYVIPSLYLAMPVPSLEETRVGLGIYSPFGLGSRWGDDVAKRWASQKVVPPGLALKLSEIRLVNVNPVIAHRLSETLSVGMGVDYFTSRVIQRTELDYAPFGNPGEVDVDMEGDGWGYNLGLQWQCSPTVSLGLTCRSEVRVDFNGDLTRKGLPAASPVRRVESDAETELTFPWSLAGGVSWQATPALRLELAVEWMDWSTWDQRQVKTDDPLFAGAPPIMLDWDDSWILMLGMECKLNEKWTLRTGYSFNETPVPTETADVDLPVGDTHALGLGLSYQFSESMAIDFGGNVSYGRAQELPRSSAPQDTEFKAISTYVSLGVTCDF